MREIRKKAFSELFLEVAAGRKTFDLRVADFECEPGDVLILDEINEANKKPTGRSVRRKVGYVLKTKELEFFAPVDVEEYGYQVMSLLPESAVTDRSPEKI